jgi:putative oxidoreductase
MIRGTDMTGVNKFAVTSAPWVQGALRIVAALTYLQHGTYKIWGFPLKPDGHPPAELSAFSLVWFAALLEIVGSPLLALGLFSQTIAFVFACEMAIGYFMVHFPKSFYPYTNGGDLALMYCLTFLFLAAAGPGKLSVDGWLARHKAAPSAGIERVT